MSYWETQVLIFCVCVLSFNVVFIAFRWWAGGRAERRANKGGGACR